jgi:hypothetical protein
VTKIVWTQQDSGGSLSIDPADGPPGVVPDRRDWTVTIIGASAPAKATSGGADLALRSSEGRSSVTVAGAATDSRIVIDFELTTDPVSADLEGRLLDVLTAAQCENELKLAAWRTLSSDQAVTGRLAELMSLGLSPELLGALTEILTARC